MKLLDFINWSLNFNIKLSFFTLKLLVYWNVYSKKKDEKKHDWLTMEHSSPTTNKTTLFTLITLSFTYFHLCKQQEEKFSSYMSNHRDDPSH
jgi:hypothetical protein